MYQGLDYSRGSGRHRWPLGQIISKLSKLVNKRQLSQLICRRMLVLVIWAVIVLFIVLKMSSESSIDNEISASARIIDVSSSTTSTNHIYPSKTDQIKFRSEEPDDNDVMTSLPKPTTVTSPKISTTTKKSTQEYVRNGKVFILLTEFEKFDPSSLYPRKSRSSSTSFSSSTINLKFMANADKRVVIPSHIRIVMEILDYHRIDYTIGSTKSGLPTNLLADDLPNSSQRPQFSVIIIDDFIRYTKLNRWLRDQLDRHCRKLQIGVITYLTSYPGKPIFDDLEIDGSISGSKLNTNLSESHKTNESQEVPQKKATTIFGTQNVHGEVGYVSSESLADQFPLSFKVIDQKSCKNRKEAADTDEFNSCLVDHQLNERSSILRLLKRRPNFVVKGSLPANVNDSPWISISSNHVTYEPLTWGKLRQKQTPNSNSRPTTTTTISQLRSTTSESSSRAVNANAVVYSQDYVDSKLPLPEYNNNDARVRNNNNDYNENDIDGDNVNDDNNGSSTMSYYDVVESKFERPTSLASKTLFPRITTRASEAVVGPQEATDPMYEFVGDNFELQTLSVFDRGLYDGIKRVIFGGANHHWLNRMLLLDAIEHLSAGNILTPLDRYIQIDIDDIFVGDKGTRLKRDDVDALVETQRLFSNKIEDGFVFNLGFSGKHYKRGFADENEGDEYLVNEARNNFTWFCHMWSHSKAHLFNDSASVELELERNLEFAYSNKLPLIGQKQPNDRVRGEQDQRLLSPTYAVAPHHSGVYPIHEQLYNAWRRKLNVAVTSTEEYPHLRPAGGRRGFVHNSIKVLPRQTCGLYTHTIFKSQYPGGLTRLVDSIQGGELFETILHNQVNVYMTHMANYANDRLAPFTFAKLIEFVQQNTNLQLKFATDPIKLAKYYFELYPHELDSPLWTNPCSDKRHLAIWQPAKHELCQFVPQMLVVGPQKTGTTALYTFMRLNERLFRSSLATSSGDFEEVQFFNDKHYSRGVDWYLSKFAVNSSMDGNSKTSRVHHPNRIYFDKSATYFDDPKAPARAAALNPNAIIVIMLVDPAARAYSWYQHARAHQDPVASSLTFEQVIMWHQGRGQGKVLSRLALNLDSKSNSNSTSIWSPNQPEVDQDQVRSLRARCLEPGFYARNLARWLDYFPARQIVVIDGVWFKQQPARVMNRLQSIAIRHVDSRVRLEPSAGQFDYKLWLVYDKRKGFYCHRKPERADELSCLGPSKGRRYPQMSEDARLYLNRLYLQQNRLLARLLDDIGQPAPGWLLEVTSRLPFGP